MIIPVASWTSLGSLDFIEASGCIRMGKSQIHWGSGLRLRIQMETAHFILIIFRKTQIPSMKD